MSNNVLFTNPIPIDQDCCITCGRLERQMHGKLIATCCYCIHYLVCGQSSSSSNRSHQMKSFVRLIFAQTKGGSYSFIVNTKQTGDKISIFSPEANEKCSAIWNWIHASRMVSLFKTNYRQEWFVCAHLCTYFEHFLTPTTKPQERQIDWPWLSHLYTHGPSQDRKRPDSCVFYSTSAEQSVGIFNSFQDIMAAGNG